jgi:glucokinase
MAQPLYLGIEIGGTKLQLGLGRGDGRLLALRRLNVRPELGGAAIREQIRATFDDLLQDSEIAKSEIAGLGIGFGGPVDSVRAVVTQSNQVEGWRDFPLAEWARHELEIAHLAIGNDAHVAALAESRFGAGVGYSPVLYATIGSGIGGGLVFDGQLYRGAGAGAVEIGHVLVPDALNASPFPTMTELELVASGWSIARAAKTAVIAEGQTGEGSWPWAKLDPESITAPLVAQAACAGDAIACSVLSNATQAMAHGLAAAVSLFAPRRIILGGGVSLLGENLWFSPIRRRLAELVFAPFRGTFDLVPAALGEEVVVHGAIALAADRDNAVRSISITSEPSSKRA